MMLQILANGARPKEMKDVQSLVNLRERERPRPQPSATQIITSPKTSLQTQNHVSKNQREENEFILTRKVWKFREIYDVSAEI